MAQERLIVTESQRAALEKAKAEKEAHDECESEHPGYCGAQDTFYVGTLKGVEHAPRPPCCRVRATRRHAITIA